MPTLVFVFTTAINVYGTMQHFATNLHRAHTHNPPWSALSMAIAITYLSLCVHELGDAESRYTSDADRRLSLLYWTFKITSAAFPLNDRGLKPEATAWA